MNKIVVYTAIFNNYDWLKDPVVVPTDIDFVCYTDSDRVCSKVWRIVKVCVEGISPSLLNRKIKLLYPYTELSQYDYSLYVDELDHFPTYQELKRDYPDKMVEKQGIHFARVEPSGGQVREKKEIEEDIKEGRFIVL